MTGLARPSPCGNGCTTWLIRSHGVAVARTSCAQNVKTLLFCVIG